MKKEICAAAAFLTSLVGKSEDLNKDQVEIFKSSLDSVLTERFSGHWFPEKPCKGQAYRCIRLNGRERRDPVLERAAEMCGLRYEDLKLPMELTVWVDPEEVCCRFGEDDGSYCTVASFKENKENEPENLVEDHHLSSNNSNQDSPESAKKQQLKKSRKPLEKQKKTSNNNNQNNKMYNSSPKSPLLPSKLYPFPNFYDWSPPTIPPFNRFNNRLHSLDFNPFRRPRKQIRTAYPNDRFHWARK